MADNITYQSATPATAPDATVVRTDDLGAAGHVQYIKLMDGTNNGTDTIGGDATNGLDVDVTRVSGTVTVDGSGVTQPVSNAGLTSLNATIFAEDAAASDGDKGIQILTVRKNTAAATSGADGDYQPLITDTNGRLHTITTQSGNVTVVGTGTFAAQVTNATAANLKTEAVGTLADDAANVTTKQAVLPGVATASAPTYTDTRLNPLSLRTDGSLRVFVTGGASNTQFAEDAAHTNGDTGTVALARRKDTPLVSSGTDGDYSTLDVDAMGRLHVNPTGAKRADILGSNVTTITSSTTETTILGATASESHDIYIMWVTNTSTTGTKVSVRDDTAGTIKWTKYVPALSTVGFSLPVDSALPQTAQNKNWTLQCGTSVASIEVACYYKKVA